MRERELLEQAADAIEALLEWVPCDCNWEMDDAEECGNCEMTEDYRDLLGRIEHWLETEDGDA